MQLAKGVEILAHSVTLLTADNHSLRKANEAISSAGGLKKTRVRLGESLSVRDAQDLIAQKEVQEQIEHMRVAKTEVGNSEGSLANNFVSFYRSQCKNVSEG